MSRIRGKNTALELRLRRAIHHAGFRYRLHGKQLPGTPDLVFPGRKAVIFINGCFWHGHSCGLFRLPKTNAEFWEKKINGNVARDRKNRQMLDNLGWRHLTVWECSLRGPNRMTFDSVVSQVIRWIEDAETSEIKGNTPA
jgi:DNA mismatch endonuclease (patch repair protein)